MLQYNDRELPVYFSGYVLITALLFLLLPRLLGLMPWDCWWVFLLVTPPVAGGVLVMQVQKEQKRRFSWLGLLVFVLASLLLGLFYRWFSYELSGIV